MINQDFLFLSLSLSLSFFLSFLNPCFYTEHPTALQLSPTQVGKLAQAGAIGTEYGPE